MHSGASPTSPSSSSIATCGRRAATSPAARSQSSCPTPTPRAFEGACRKALAGEQSTVIHRVHGRVHRSMFAGSRDERARHRRHHRHPRRHRRAPRARGPRAPRARVPRASPRRPRTSCPATPLDGTYLYISPACRRLFGFEPEEMLGHSAYDNIHPDDAARTAGADRTTLDRDRAAHRPVPRPPQGRRAGAGWRARSGTRATPRPAASSTRSP